MAHSKTKIAVFISGSGSNLQVLIDACRNGDIDAEIVCVVSNKPEVKCLDRAAKAGIDTVVVSHRQYDEREAFDQALLKAIAPYQADLICLAGFMRILTPGFVSQWEGRMLNTHPALLPKHGGEGMYGEHVHRAVLDAKDAESGVSVHYVIPEVDQGPVILQRRVSVLKDDTPDTLAARVLEQEHIAYPQAVKIWIEKQV
jgi:phosphoribosylglycinamide formyltransferase-1